MKTEDMANAVKDNAYEIAINVKVAEELIKEKGVEGRSKDILEAVAYESITRQIFGNDNKKRGEL